jgi:hypothetical protein
MSEQARRQMRNENMDRREEYGQTKPLILLEPTYYRVF